MTTHYSSAESYYVKTQREEREPGVDLIKCSDGLYRTAQEKADFDRVDTAVLSLPAA